MDLVAEAGGVGGRVGGLGEWSFSFLFFLSLYLERVILFVLLTPFLLSWARSKLLHRITRF